ncbi:MAG TPA: hypothetical protein VMT62_00370, partial [Syntrophorhabdaceae bacterium]|nr:hypothetical protein [Syntrophorhabdaceae bacterium]
GGIVPTGRVDRHHTLMVGATRERSVLQGFHPICKRTPFLEWRRGVLLRSPSVFNSQSTKNHYSRCSHASRATVRFSESALRQGSGRNLRQ